jgi:hypothetical protein
MRKFTFRLLNAALLTGALMMPALMTPTALRAQDHRSYHDKKHNDDHEWNDHEDKAYRIWVTQNHRKYNDFAKIKESDRQSYWGWRHDHSDALLKIEIH